MMHPLDALSKEEITATAGACNARAKEEGLPPLRFNVITLKVLLGCTMACQCASGMMETASKFRKMRRLTARRLGTAGACEGCSGGL